MSEIKTKPNNASVAAFIAGIKDDRQRADAKKIVAMMKEITGKKPVMWGTAIVGFDKYTYKYGSGQTGDWPMTAFSPRKQNTTIYLMPGFQAHTELLSKLGKHKTAVSCLYIKSLADIDLSILKKLIAGSYKLVQERHPS